MLFYFGSTEGFIYHLGHSVYFLLYSFGFSSGFFPLIWWVIKIAICVIIDGKISMKIFFLLTTLILSSVLTASAASEQSAPIALGDLVERGGIYFKKFEDKPYTGFVKHDLESENPRYRRLEYFERKEKADFKLPMKGTGKIEHGKKEGAWKYYHTSGQLLWVFNYANNNFDGAIEYYYLSGQLYKRVVFDAGNVVSIEEFNQNGSRSLYEKLKDGIPVDGVAESYYSNGQLERKEIFNHCCVISKSYYENGQLESEASYRQGDITFFGINRGFYENGQLKYDRPKNKNGDDIGEHRLFYENGQLQFREIYENGKRISYEEYYLNGHIQYEYVKIFGVDRNLYVEYFPDGTIRAIHRQVNGMKDGIFIRIGEDKEITRYNIYTAGKVDKRIYP
jgi:antitoxin component YwqK of YwqJK toxin-antitoxin module